MAFSEKALEEMYVGALEFDDDDLNEKKLVVSISLNQSRKPRTVYLTIHFFRRCIRGEVYRLGVTIPHAKYAISRAISAGNRMTLQNTLWCIEDYLAWSHDKKGNRRPGLIKIIDEFKATHLETIVAPSIEDWISYEDDKAGKAAALDIDELRRRANKASADPVRKEIVTISARRRNPYVRQLALHIANGVCSGCDKQAPFRTKDGVSFLEVHHKIPLAEDGPDTIENTIALCPNCHREAHYGENWEKFRK